MADDEKKIIVDDDWKKQAQAEKEKVQKELEEEKQKEQTQQLPEGNFSSLVSMLATQSFYALGLIGNPEDGSAPEPNIELAKYTIDMLNDLEEKTKGNLSKEEEEILKAAVSQLRMAFVQVSQNSSKE